MYYPAVGERVWVSGCRDEFVVAQTDYTRCVATIVPAHNKTRLRRTPFFSLFAHSDLEAARAGSAAPPAVREVLRSSQLHIDEVTIAIRDLRETVRTTVVSIRDSRALIFESDRVIARLQSLDCNSNEDDSEATDILRLPDLPGTDIPSFVGESAPIRQPGRSQEEL